MAVGPLTYESLGYYMKWGRCVCVSVGVCGCVRICVYVLYMCVSVQATDRSLQAFISPNLREKQLLLRLCIPTSMCKRNVKCKQLPLANTVPVSICLLSFASCTFQPTFSVAPSSFLLSFLVCLTSSLSPRCCSALPAVQ